MLRRVADQGFGWGSWAGLRRELALHASSAKIIQVNLALIANLFNLRQLNTRPLAALIDVRPFQFYAYPDCG